MMYQEENLHISSDSGCAEIRERLSVYLDGELPAAEATALEAHLAVCPACADEAEKLRRLCAELAAAALTPPPALRAKVLAAVRREKRARMIRRFTSIGAVGIAAMFCVIVIGGFIGDLFPVAWLNYGQTFGFANPIVLDLGILVLSFSLTIKITVASILGVILALVIYHFL